MFDATAIILSGGKGSRMGSVDKSRIKIDDTPIIEHLVEKLSKWFKAVIIVTCAGRTYDFPNVEVVIDAEPDFGPVMGLYCGIKASANEFNFVMACDMPWPNEKIIALLLSQIGDHQAAMAQINGKYQSLMALYRKEIEASLLARVSARQHRLIDFLDHLDIALITEAEIKAIDPLMQVFTNLNTMADLATARKHKPS